MLIRITNKCRMGCNHCMVDAKPDGESMTMETFKDVVAFVGRFQFQVAMLSGGEPTEHPDLLKMIDILQAEDIIVMVLSNGMFIEEKPELADILIEKKIMIQVTRDPRFYPVDPHWQIDFPKFVKEYPNFCFEDHIRMVSPFGRALTNKLECNRQSPLCFNLRSIGRKLRDFTAAVLQLRLMHKMCIPSINPDGTLVAGEAPSCHVIGCVTDNNLTLTNNLCQMKCNKCGLANDLPPEYRHAIGES